MYFNVKLRKEKEKQKAKNTKPPKYENIDTTINAEKVDNIQSVFSNIHNIVNNIPQLNDGISCAQKNNVNQQNKF